MDPELLRMVDARIHSLNSRRLLREHHYPISETGWENHIEHWTKRIGERCTILYPRG